ncbi:MAG: aspartate dehydrogenase [Thaumarchaeota archaeon]|nr:aspartate dehydrogenase [Nitrososphaerota archaeon]
MKTIGLLGCGSIGTEIALAIDQGKITSAKLTHIYDKSLIHAKNLISKLKTKPILVNNAALLATSEVDLVVEAASQQAVRDFALTIIQNKKDLMILSVGALVDESIFDVLTEASRKFNTNIFLPSGAIVGLDGIKSIKNELRSITLVTKKNPTSFQGAKFFKNNKIKINDIQNPLILFDGTAKNAIPLFQQNVNVAALLSLAGIGINKTNVKIIADPNLNKNLHIIKAQGEFGKITIKIENNVSSNPKTSRLAILSAIECLRSICSTTNMFIGT